MVNVYWVERFDSFDTSAAGWVDYDITSNLGVPPGAVAHIAMGNLTTADFLQIGVRAKSSTSTTRYAKLHEAEGMANGVVFTTMYVKVESGGLITLYIDSAVKSRIFILLGYWMGVDYTELSTLLSNGSNGVWLDVDAYALGVPKGAVLDVQCWNRNDGGTDTLGVRTDGSTLNRTVALHEAESASAESTDVTAMQMLVKTHPTTGVVEVYKTANTGMFVMFGYFGSQIDYVELITNIPYTSGSASEARVWETEDLSALLDSSPRVCDIWLSHNSRETNFTLGSRCAGSALARIVTAHESESNGYNGLLMPTKTDHYGRLENYALVKTFTYYYITGYYVIGTMPPDPVDNTLLMPKTIRSADALTMLPPS